MTDQSKLLVPIDSLLNSGRSALDEHRWQDATHYYAKLRSQDPNDWRGYGEVCLAHRQLSQWEEADAIIEEGLTKIGEVKELLIAYGDNAMDTQRWEEALIRWKRYRLHEPKDLYGYTRGAEALLRLNKEEEAAELYRRGLIFVEIERNGIERFDQLEIAFPHLMPGIAKLQVIKKLQDFRPQWIEPKDLAAYFRKLGKSVVSHCRQEYGNIINAAEVAGCELTDQQNFTLEIPAAGFSLDTFTIRNCSNFSIRIDQAAGFIDCSQQHNLHGFVIEGCTNFFISNLKIASARNPLVISQCNSFIIDECQINNSRGCGLIIHGSTRFMLRDSLFERNLSAGINLIGDCQDAIIEGCKVADCKGYFNWDAGLNLCATSHAINLEHIPDTYHEALPLLEKKAAPLRIQIRNCEFSDNRAQGIYLEGAQNCHLTHNRILKNNKEGICLDWGTTACVLESNELQENGYRAKVGEFEARVDFIEGVPVLEDGSSVCKLPAISLDNAALNLLRKNRITRNYGGGVKTVRTAIWNRIEDNDIIGNAHAGHILDKYHFHGVCLLGLKNLGGEFTGEAETRADLEQSFLNVVYNNNIDDHKLNYYSPHSHFNLNISLQEFRTKKNFAKFFDADSNKTKKMNYEKEIKELKESLRIARRDSLDALTMTLLRSSAASTIKKSRVAFIGVGNVWDSTVYACIEFDKISKTKNLECKPEYIYLCRNTSEYEHIKRLGLNCEIWRHQPWLSQYLLECKWVVLSNHVYASPGDCLLNASISGSKKIQVWHGYPAKSVGYGSIELNKDIHFTSRLAEDTLSINAATIPTFHPEAIELYKKSFPNAQLFTTGDPRTDPLFLQTHSSIIQEENPFSLWVTQNKKNKKIIYMPTFRDEKTEAIDFHKKMIIFIQQTLLENPSISIALKLHPATKKQLLIDEKKEFYEISKNSRFTILDTHNQNIYQVLKLFDCLMTDYSSIRFDYLATEKPILLWRPDKMLRAEINDIYKEIDCASYLLQKDTSPKNQIEEILIKDSLRERRISASKSIHPFQDGKSSQRVANLIYSFLI